MHIPISDVREMEIQQWLTAYIASLLELSPDEVSIDDTMASYGLDSSAAVGLVADLSSWLKCNLEPELAYSYPTIESLARHIAQRNGNGQQTIDHR